MPATAELATTNDVVAILEDKEMTLAELREVVDDKALGRAWAGGLIEFGQPNFCIQSPLGGEHSVLIFEGGIHWSGPKTPAHKPLAGIVKDAEATPEYGRQGRYERADLPMIKKTDPRTEKETFHRPLIKFDEAKALLALRVRLTDKGLAMMG